MRVAAERWSDSDVTLNVGIEIQEGTTGHQFSDATMKNKARSGIYRHQKAT